MRWSCRTVSLVSVFFALFAPATALAKQSLAVTSPTGFPAGGHPTYTTTASLDTGAGTPSAVTVSLAPGVLASPSANPSCLTAAGRQHPAGCQIGTGHVSTVLLGVGVPFTAYLAPPPSPADVVGIDIVAAVPGIPVTHAGARLVQTKAGNVQTVLGLSLSGLGPLANLVSGMTLTVDGTLDGKPFNRMPTNCSPGHSALKVVYAKRTETVLASPDFAPTGCSRLPFAPQLTGRGVASGTHQNQVVTTITQAADESAPTTETLTLPSSPTVAINPGVLLLLGKHVPVGTALAVSPLLAKPLRAQIFLTGSLQKPRLLFKFPPPAALTLTGVPNLSTDAVTIPVVPDVPLTELRVTFPGGPKSLLAVSCVGRPAILRGRFTAQSGRTAQAKHRMSIEGCPAH